MALRALEKKLPTVCVMLTSKVSNYTFLPPPLPTDLVLSVNLSESHITIIIFNINNCIITNSKKKKTVAAEGNRTQGLLNTRQSELPLYHDVT